MQHSRSVSALFVRRSCRLSLAHENAVGRGDVHMTGQILLVRPGKGTVGERQRAVHVAPLSEYSEQSSRMEVLCGKEFNVYQLDFLDRVTGMPCEDCLRHVSVADPEWLPPQELEFKPALYGYVYEQLANHLAGLIESGWLRPGKPLQPERRLADEYRVSLGTVRHATRLLKFRGLVVTVRSKGTYVVDRASRVNKWPESGEGTRSD